MARGLPLLAARRHKTSATENARALFCFPPPRASLRVRAAEPSARNCRPAELGRIPAKPQPRHTPARIAGMAAGGRFAFVLRRAAAGAAAVALATGAQGSLLQCKALTLDGVDIRRERAVTAEDHTALLALVEGVSSATLQWRWRRARALHDVATAESAMPAAERQAMLERALAEVDAALAAAAAAGKTEGAELGAAWRWRGTILSALTSYMDTKGSIAASPRIRDAWVQAVQLDELDASAMHLLGRWYCKMASLSWLERTAASVLFGTPPPATYEEALAWFERAEEAQPGFWLANRVRLADTLLLLGRPAEAEAWAERAAAMEVVTADDVASRAELDAMAAKQGWSVTSPPERA